MVQSPSLSAQSAFRVGLGIFITMQYSLLSSSVVRAVLFASVIVVRITDVKQKNYLNRSPLLRSTTSRRLPGDRICQNMAGSWDDWHCGMVTEAPAPAPACDLPDPQRGGNKKSSLDHGVPSDESARQIRNGIPLPKRRCHRCSAPPAPNEGPEVVVRM